MRNIKTLLALELRSLFGINKFLYTKDSKKKKTYKLLLAVWSFLVVMIVFYVCGVSFVMAGFGAGDKVPVLLFFISSSVIFIFGLFGSAERIFGRGGFEIIAALPIKKISIITARFATLYLENAVITLIITVPGIITVGIIEAYSPFFYLTAVLGSLFIPVIPISITVFIGSLIILISRGSRYKSIIQSLLSVVFIVLVLIFTMQVGGYSEELDFEKLASIVKDMAEKLGRMYPPSLWLGKAAVGVDYLGIVWFLAATFGAAAISFALTFKFFESLMNSLWQKDVSGNYKVDSLRSRGMLRALYLKEAKRYFSSSIYVTNTIVGPIMGMLISAALLVTGLDTVGAVMPFDIRAAIPVAIGAVFTMMPTTAVSISMEGGTFYIVKSLPVSAKKFFDSKILLNLSLMLPFYVISEILLIIALKPNFYELLAALLIPAAQMLFASVFGISVNLKLHSFDWEREDAVVKQSAAAAIGGFGGLLLSLPILALIIICPNDFKVLFNFLIISAVLGVTVFLYQRNNKTNLEEL